MKSICKRLAQAWREESGVASIEFVFAIPILLAIFMASFESGLFMTREIMLEHAVDMVMRELRLGHYPAPVTTDKMKTEICSRTVVFNDCASNIMIELTSIVPPSYTLPADTTDCRDVSKPIAPSTSLVVGQENELMLVRVCIVVDALFPTTGIGLNLTRSAANGGGVAIVAVSAYANEPS